tara:strand:- start:9679 stop:11838 length:2160 start_codon:yes stop_codon:yes gene_type:complete
MAHSITTTNIPDGEKSEETLNGLMDNMVAQGRKRTDQFLAMYRDAVRYVYGDQIGDKKRKKNWEYPVMNRMFADMMQEIAMLTSNNPRLEVVPVEDTDIEDAKIVDGMLRYTWSVEQNMRLKAMQAELDNHLSGFMLAKWYWEPTENWNEERQNYDGRAEVVIVNPQYFGCDEEVESAFDIPTKARYLWTERWVDKAWAAFRWEKYADWLEEQGEGDQVNKSMPVRNTATGTDERDFNRSTYAWAGKEKENDTEEFLQRRLADAITSLTGNNQKSQLDANQRETGLVKVQEFFIRDYTLEDLPKELENIPFGEPGTEHILKMDDNPLYYDSNRPKEDGEGFEMVDVWPQRNKNKGKKRPKYPVGRVIVRVGDKVIVEDRAYGVIDYGVSRRIIASQWPFAVAPNSFLPHIWQGVNGVELSRGFQDWMNTVSSHFLNNLKFFADPLNVIEEGAIRKGNDRKQEATVPNWAGGILQLKRGMFAKFRREPPVGIPESLFRMFELFKRQDQDLKGVHDVAQGRASSGEQTLGELQMLNRNTRLRVAMKGAILDEWMKNVARGLVELKQAHLRPDEWIRIVGATPEAVQSSMKWSSGLADAKVDIIFEPASTLPFDEEKEQAKYVKAYEFVGDAMLKDVLEKLKIQNIDEILERHSLTQVLTQIMEMASELQLPPDQVMAALERQLMLQSTLSGQGAPPQGGGQPPSGGGQPAQPAEPVGAGVS